MPHIRSSVMIIGCGRHAFRNHLRALLAITDRWKNLVIVDTEDRLPLIREGIEKSFASLKDNVVYVGLKVSDLSEPNCTELPVSLSRILDGAVSKHDVDKVIIATDPEYHVAYACWALNMNVHMLMDKPISAPPNLRTDPDSVERIYGDYQRIRETLALARQKNPTLVCTILAQRRNHLGFQKVLSLIEEVANKYGVGVTAFQSLHSDGQWRPPHEIISQDYHTYNRGYGKGLHSGYHAIDIANYMVNKSWQQTLLTPNVTSEFIYPDDYLAAFPTTAQYELLGSNISNEQNEVIQNELSATNYLQYGEISAHLLVDYRNGSGKKVSAGTISLLHDSVSQRDWSDTKGRELYKNGRVRHESHYFASGPLQAIKVVAMESHDMLQPDGVNIGEAWNFDIHVFRNTGVIKGSPAYQLITIDKIYQEAGRSLTDPLKDSRNLGMEDFFDCVDEGRISSLSDYTDHERTMQLMSKMYQSALN